ncbi:unnamed protein product [Lactuca saligna]|uniref:P53 and DNA damage-regulated protein 1 n=1 Tax=Lactuca saligna TaxID=75948 RepID=A0AA36E232_LACSI|nr:unnamed protein product [Lactuca saligna]
MWTNSNFPKKLGNDRMSLNNIRRLAPPALISVLDNADLQPCDLRSPCFRLKMDDTMKKFQGKLIEIETEAEELLLARHQLVENDRLRNGNREALTALRKKARTTKTSVPSPFELLMKEVDQSKPLVKEICATCGNHHDSNDKTWMMFPGTDIFARVPFHAAHTILEKDQTKLDFDVKKLQSYVKEKSLFISEQGVLADKIGPGVLKSLVTLQDKPR